MRKVLLFFLFLAVLQLSAQAQRVGVVLSGGGAKGIAHIGVLRALEENEIPIDYMVGTSMGGLVAGCYAAGMSPDQIETIILSDDFLRWINGQHLPGYNSYYYKDVDNPGFVTLSLSLDSSLNAYINTSIANDVSLNFALAEKMAQAEAISKRNFDSLFVPLRIMAADVFTQSQVTFSKGSLSNALRATHTVPFFYTPIRVDGKYLFDGGVYNNFPVDVMQRDFAPDVIIGSNVSNKIHDEYPFGQDDQLLNNSMLFMFLDKSDPEQIPATGVYIQPNLKGYSALDFTHARALIDSGYNQTIRQIAELKSKIAKRVTCEEVAEVRNRFNDKGFPLAFDEVKYHDFNSKQETYLRRVFGLSLRKPKDLTFEEVKSKYFELVSEDYFNNIHPNISFNQQRKKFVLELTERQKKNFQTDFGGVIATRDISNIFVGFNFFHFNKQLMHAYAAFQTGNFYKSVVTRARIDFPFLGRIYVEPQFVFNNWSYVSNSDLLRDVKPTILQRYDRDYSLKIGWPLGRQLKAYIQGGRISNKDSYINESVFSNTSKLDELRIKGFKGTFSFSHNNLNRKQYASSGQSYSLTVNYFNVQENYKPGTTSFRALNYFEKHQWFSAKIQAEQYLNKGWFRPGFLFEAAYSNQSFFANYQGTLINLPAFNPLPDSRTLFLEKFRAFSYVAGGSRIVFTLAPKLDLRVEGYIFKPFQSLIEIQNQRSAINTQLLKVSFTAMTGFVYHSPVGPVSLMGNYYDDEENQFGVFMHIGFLLFNKPSGE